ncbi:MAG: immunoglobulin domain-containing protein [Planctomycetes bacterium]|nr:immunoglobulin domain-containing protein [Planctomycetota bacterium]
MSIRPGLMLGIGCAIGLLWGSQPLAAQTGGVWFYRDDEPVRVERSTLTASSAAGEAIGALVAGPTAEEAGQGITSAIPAGTSVTGLAVTAEAIAVDLSPEVLAGLDEAALLGIYDQFRLTLAGWPEIASVRLTCKAQLLSSYLTPVMPVESTAPAIPAGGVTTGVGLAGRNITIGPSHGRFWNGSGWYWQRGDPCGLGEAVLEDTNSIRLTQFLYQYLVQDGATVHSPRQLLNEADCCHSETNLPWWKMCAQSWLRNSGLPCSVWANSSGNCGADSATSRSSDDIRARPLFADYRGSDIYISCHTNAAGGTGTETFRDTAMEHPAHETASYNLALAVNDNVISAIREMYDSGWANRGVKDSAGGFGEIRIPDRPAILIELAFHDRCDKDALYLVDNFFRSVAEWGLYRGVCQYFGNTPTWDRYSCEYVSDTIPSSMVPSQSYNVSVTFRNRGVLWSEARSFRLGAVNDSDPFTTSNRVTISGEVRPGNTYSFNFIMTAPTIPGIYTTDWRMVRDGVTWFGPTHAEQVEVSGEDTPPVITNHPTNQNAAGGATVVFTLDAGGTPPLSYQWQKDTVDLINGGRISGATSSTLQIASADSVDNGSYRCIVSNAFGTATSNAATLTVVTGPSTWIVETRSGGQNYTTNFSKVGTWADVTGKSTAAGTTAGIGHIYTSTAYAGRSATYSFTPGTTGAWRVYATWVTSSNACPNTRHVVTHAGGSASVIMNQTTGGNTWNLVGEFTLNAGTQYTVAQTTDGSSGGGIIRSDAIKWERVVQVIDPPTITQHPAARYICPGTNTTFSVTASGQGPLTYRWQKDNVNLNDAGHYSGVTTTTLTVTGADAGDLGGYRCIVTNAGGSTPSNAAALTFKPATTITQHPEPQSIPLGGSASFTVAASGEGTLSYQWRKDGVNLTDDARITGTTTATVSIVGFVGADVGDYGCVVTGGCGTTTSGSAALTVLLPPHVPGDTDDDDDVDMEDFGVIQACLTGPDEPQTDAACSRAKLDLDEDVDEADIAIFLQCMTGPGVPGDVNCSGL